MAGSSAFLTLSWFNPCVCDRLKRRAGGLVRNHTVPARHPLSITGPIRLPEHADGLWLLDSIVDGIGGTALSATGSLDQPGPPMSLERVTVFGPSYVKKLPLASEAILTEPVVAAQRQDGCCRFSFVPHGSATPRRYRCQPELEIASQIEQAEKAAQASNTTLTRPKKMLFVRRSAAGSCLLSLRQNMASPPTPNCIWLPPSRSRPVPTCSVILSSRSERRTFGFASKNTCPSDWTPALFMRSSPI
jgi:hypothetical protein